MQRRDFLLAVGAASLFWRSAAAAETTPVPFDADTVAGLARARAARPYRAPPQDLPRRLASINYDAYRSIRFRPESALWKADGLPFQAQFFHRGFYFPKRVDLFQVEDGRASLIPYDPSWFISDKTDLSGLPSDLGYAGFRLHGQLNRPDYFDEIAVFQGASYFRSLGRSEVYGLSARGLALNTAGAGGEEFPDFSQFWIERPAKGAQSIVVHALLDSPSVAGAFRFAIRPGDRTVFDVEARLFPRVELKSVGVAPLTSMFLFGPASGRRFDDFRPAVHDSDGLQILNGHGEQLWRPLTNPNILQESTFLDQGPRGFGLIQRSRKLSDFEDLETRYDLRPSVWVEPQGDWGAGAVHLVEISSGREIDDNIVAFWRPQAPLQPGREHQFRYRLNWGPPPPVGKAQVVRTGAGEGFNAKDVRLFTVDFADDGSKTRWDGVKPSVTTSAGTLSPPTLSPNPETGGVRVDVQLRPGSSRVAELRANLVRDGQIVSETWMYRWTA
jgi:glucans biosynthesis protein